jgi:glutathione synthase/RimK-type ligase-like ATP-grasp enzyme
MIAIHSTSGAFSRDWQAYCQEKQIPFRKVDCFASNIIEQIKGCRVLLWHWAHNDYRAQLFARQLIISIEEMGIRVFPNSATCWHYDDKVGQKYLLEAVGAPIVPTYIFYNREDALRWVDTASFPKVWKLRGGAGSQNVRLVRSPREAQGIVRRSFSAGWRPSRFHPLKERLWHFHRDRNLESLANVGRGLLRVIVPHVAYSRNSVQRDYVYFQDCIPGNNFDIRVVVIGNRAFAIKRGVRDGDFRASGSGVIWYSRAEIPVDCVSISFEVTAALRSQCCAFDFVRCGEHWLIVEVSYAFTADAYRKCPGFWDRSLVWHTAPVTPERFMLQDLLCAAENGVG